MPDESHLIETETHLETIYLGRVVKLYLRTVKLPNGRESQREIIKHPGAVAVVPILDDGRVILIRQFRGALEKVTWEIPAGTLEPNEEAEPAAARELQEEIGYVPNSLIKLGGIHVAPGYSSEFIHIYLANQISESRLDGDEDEFIDQYPMALEEALTMVYRGDITDAKTVTGLLLAKQYLSK